MTGDDEISYEGGFQSLGRPVDDVDWSELGTSCLVCDADATAGERRRSPEYGNRPIAIPRFFRLCVECADASRSGDGELLERLPDPERAGGKDYHFVALVCESLLVAD